MNMSHIIQVALLVLSAVGIFYLLFKNREKIYGLGAVLVFFLVCLAIVVIPFDFSLRCLGSCPSSPDDFADIKFLVVFFELLFLGVALIFPRITSSSKNSVSQGEYLSTPIVVTGGEHSIRRFKDIFSGASNNKWYIPILGVMTFVAGYFSFGLIVILQAWMLAFTNSSILDFSTSVYFRIALVEQVFLGGMTLIIFLISRKYYFPLLLYAGFLVQYVQVVHNNYIDYLITAGNVSFVSFLNPVFIYVLILAILALGLRFGKTIGLILAISVNIFVHVDYNSRPYPIAEKIVSFFTGVQFPSASDTHSTLSDTILVQEKLANQSSRDPGSAVFVPTANMLVASSSPINIALISWRILDADSREIRTWRDAESGTNFCLYNIGDIISGAYQGKIVSLIVAQGNTPCDISQPLKSYGYILTDRAGNSVAWNYNYLHFQYEQDPACDAEPYDSVCSSANFRRYLGLLDNSIDTLPLPFEMMKLANGYIFTKKSPNRANFSFVDKEFFTLFPVDISNTVGRTFEQIDSTPDGSAILKETKTISSLNSVLPNISYYLMLPFGRALQIVSEPDFISADAQYPKLGWSVGDSVIKRYSYGRNAKGWQECFTHINAQQLVSALVETGTTDKIRVRRCMGLTQ